MARQLGMSQTSFYKSCMRYYGKSPSRIITDIKMRKAGNLLRFTELSINDIAAQLAYADQFAFSKAFTKVMKLSPSRFRKQRKHDS